MGATCRVLGLSSSGFYACLTRPRSASALRDDLRVVVHRSYEDSQRTRIHADSFRLNSIRSCPGSRSNPAKRCPKEDISAWARADAANKSLSRIERAFRSFKTVDLKVRPVHHRLAGRVRAHVFLCMLAYYVEWHMRRALAPLLFDDHDAQARSSPVEPARASPAARAKAHGRKRTRDGLPVHSFRTLLADLATLARNRVQPPGAAQADVLTQATPVQERALRLLGVKP